MTIARAHEVFRSDSDLGAELLTGRDATGALIDLGEGFLSLILCLPEL